MNTIKKLLAAFFDSPKMIVIFTLLLLALAWGGATMSYGIVKNKLLTKSKQEVTRLVNDYGKLSAATKAVVSLLKKKDLKIVALQAALGREKKAIHKDQRQILETLDKEIRKTDSMSASKLAKELTKLGY